MSKIPQEGLYVEPDQNITRFSTGHYVPRITVTDGFIMIEDPWLGPQTINDPIMRDFHTTPNAFRALGVSQLCKSKESSTIPNLASFNRQWGLLAQYPLVEHFAKMQGLDENHTRAIHIAVEGDDQAHTAFSHELELAQQRWGGPENNHEKAYPRIAKRGGTRKALEAHNVKLNKKMRVPGYALPEWAHATDRDDLDVDRLQYIAAEALLWFDHDYVDTEVRKKVIEALDLQNFVLTEDGRLAVKDAGKALVISKLLMLFSTEHWNDPINRAHLHLGIHGVQRSIITRRLEWMDEIDRGETREPTSYFYGIDQDYTDALETGPGKADNFIYLVSNVLNQSGMEERRKFMDYRLAEYCRFIMDDDAQNYPSEYLAPKRVEFGPRSSSVDTEVVRLSDEQKEALRDVKIPQLEDDEDTLSYIAGPLKNRRIDPLVKTERGFKKLSEVKRCYKKLKKEHAYLQELGVRVSFAFTPDYAQEFREGMRQNDVKFEGLHSSGRSAMTADQERRLIVISAERAKALAVTAGTLVLKGRLAA